MRSIQILRAVAILGVLALHVMERWSISTGRPLAPSAHIGAYGVDLFFVISGFIVCTVATRASAAANFLRDRFVRVAPLYYLMTIPWLRFAAALGTLTPAAIATSLLFWPAWGRTPAYPVLAAGWTLGLEALFYCSLGVIVQFRRRAAIALAIGYALALALNLAGTPGVVRYVGNPLLLEFLLGAAIALRPIRPRPRAGAAAVVLAGLLLGVWCAFGIGETWN
ncbi:MAG TPA: acyltransferase family protein, partial [Caulobacteraceae bacterium]|nr:acyltransferase family protein [Caulobacteraceae bacterium]